MNDAKRGTGRACAVVLLIFLLLAAAIEYKTGICHGIAYIVGVSIKETLHRTSFDSAKWKDPKLVHGSDPIRIRMVDDLINSRKLMGMTKKQVVSLLGKPDGAYSPNDCYYYLGPERGWLKIDIENLIIKFGPSGIVVGVETSTT